jgi:hypothetical protein
MRGRRRTEESCILGARKDMFCLLEELMIIWGVEYGPRVEGLEARRLVSGGVKGKQEEREGRAGSGVK